MPRVRFQGISEGISLMFELVVFIGLNAATSTFEMKGRSDTIIECEARRTEYILGLLKTNETNSGLIRVECMTHAQIGSHNERQKLKALEHQLQGLRDHERRLRAIRDLNEVPQLRASGSDGVKSEKKQDRLESLPVPPAPVPAPYPLVRRTNRIGA
jgi:hypothetical protein